jgi:hypothetical protein
MVEASRQEGVGNTSNIIERQQTTSEIRGVMGYKLPRRIWKCQQVNTKITKIRTAWVVSYYGGEGERRGSPSQSCEP